MSVPSTMWLRWTNAVLAFLMGALTGWSKRLPSSALVNHSFSPFVDARFRRPETYRLRTTHDGPKAFWCWRKRVSKNDPRLDRLPYTACNTIHGNVGTKIHFPRDPRICEQWVAGMAVIGQG